MTVRKTEWLPDGSCVEYEANAGAEPIITLDGKPITLEHYHQITGQKKTGLIEFIKGLFNVKR